MRRLNNRNALPVTLAVALALLLMAPSLRDGEPPGPHEDFGARAEIVEKDVPYVESMPDNKRLWLYVYSNPHEGLWPVAVMIHGGGWMEGDKSMDNKVYICKVLAKNGYVVFNVNYRLLPEVRIKKQAEDVMAAVIWAKEHAEEYGGDPSRVGVMGGSAGGHLGALVAWASDDDWFIPTGDPISDYDSDVKAAALYYPVIDLERTLWEVTWILAPTARHLLIGPGKREKLKHLSPHNHVDETVPPTLFLTGDADELKLYPQSVEYSQALLDLGVDSKVYTAPGKKHGFTWNYWEDESVQSDREIVEFFDKHVR